MMTKIITISREFGSGGREIGHRLSERLGIPFYDKQLIKMAAEDIELEEHIFELYDDAFMEKEEMKYTPFSTIYEVPMSDQIFIAQSRVIHRLAEHGPCVIVGRCADMVLKDEQCLNLFFYANFKKRVQRLMEKERMPESELKAMEKKFGKSTGKGRIITSIIREMNGENRRTTIYAWTARKQVWKPVLTLPSLI